MDRPEQGDGQGDKVACAACPADATRGNAGGRSPHNAKQQQGCRQVNGQVGDMVAADVIAA